MTTTITTTTATTATTTAITTTTTTTTATTCTTTTTARTPPSTTTRTTTTTTTTIRYLFKVSVYFRVNFKCFFVFKKVGKYYILNLDKRVNIPSNILVVLGFVFRSNVT